MEARASPASLLRQMYSLELDAQGTVPVNATGAAAARVQLETSAVEVAVVYQNDPQAELLQEYGSSSPYW